MKQVRIPLSAMTVRPSCCVRQYLEIKLPALESCTRLCRSRLIQRVLCSSVGWVPPHRLREVVQSRRDRTVGNVTSAAFQIHCGGFVKRKPAVQRLAEVRYGSPMKSL